MSEAAVKSVAFDRAAEYYDQTRAFPGGVDEQAVELLCHVGGLGARSTVLELGVGTGRIALPLGGRVGRLIGVDIARPMLARLREKPGSARVTPILADVLALPFADASFDAVVSVHVFHLVPEWRRVLAEVRRVLAPGGRLLNAEESRLLPELWDEAYGDMAQPAHVGVPRHLKDFPVHAGFRSHGEPRCLRYRSRFSMAAFLNDIERRVWSITWRLGDDEHARLCANMRRAILARWGQLDTTLEVEREFNVRAFE
jgi:ubiquinone/menaquinone biosynthesis C-methylase UbiE